MNCGSCDSAFRDLGSIRHSLTGLQAEGGQASSGIYGKKVKLKKTVQDIKCNKQYTNKSNLIKSKLQYEDPQTRVHT